MALTSGVVNKHPKHLILGQPQLHDPILPDFENVAVEMVIKSTATLCINHLKSTMSIGAIAQVPGCKHFGIADWTVLTGTKRRSAHLGRGRS